VSKRSPFRTLPRAVYCPSAAQVAPALLGHLLIRNLPQGPLAGVIVETEAYLHDDPACHAFRGRTARNEAMWGAPGHAYVYFIYGCYYCFNATCLPTGRAEAVLIRAVEPVLGIETMQQRRPARSNRQLTDGPGKLCQALDIDRRLDGADLCDPASAVCIAVNPQIKTVLRQSGPVVTTTRIGINQAANLPLRFYFQSSEFVSRRASAGLTPLPAP